jgi:hypothetical protein
MHFRRIHFQDLTDLRCGIVKEICLGDLPTHIAHQIGAIRGRGVWLSKEFIHHITEKHPDQRHDEIETIPQALECGRIVLDVRREQWLTVDYFPRLSDRRCFLLALKCNRTGEAIYARSWHLLKERQVVRLPTRGYVLREHA